MIRAVLQWGGNHERIHVELVGVPEVGEAIMVRDNVTGTETEYRVTQRTFYTHNEPGNAWLWLRAKRMP